MGNTSHIAAELGARPAEIFDMYLDPRTHAAITSAPATVAPRAGTQFAAFGKTLRGRILHLLPKRLIVQSWRASRWNCNDLDSMLTLSLRAIGRARTRVEIVHVNVPDHDFAGACQGWGLYYWGPWREYLKTRRPARGGRANPSPKNALREIS